MVKRACCIGEAGDTKVGKSRMGATFCMLQNEPSGIVLDFSRILQDGGFNGKTPTYNLVSDENEVGEAYPACMNVGLDMENQYKLITKWDDFENAIEFARYYQDILGRKKLWLVIDDTVGMRWHKVLDISQKAKHKSIAKDDWKVATPELKLLISRLSKEFNLLLINQIGPEYISGEKTGLKEPDWIPGKAEFLFDGLFTIHIIKTPSKYGEQVIKRKQVVEILSGREMWQCDDNFNPWIENPTAEKILESLGIKQDRW